MLRVLNEKWAQKSNSGLIYLFFFCLSAAAQARQKSEHMTG